MDTPKSPIETDSIPFKPGTQAVLRDGGDKVIVINEDLDLREIEMMDDRAMFDGIGYKKQTRWVNMADLMVPFQIPPHDQAPIETGSTIAERELNAAVKKDQQIAGLLRETSRMSDTIDAQDREIALKDELIKALKADLAMERERTTELQRAIVAERPPVKRKIETQTHDDIGDDVLADMINAGWRVVFEAAYVLPAYNKEVCHMVRLEREVQEPASPPQDEARTAVEIPPIDDAPPTPPADDEDDDDKIKHPRPAEIFFHVKPPVTMHEPIDPALIDLTQPLGENVRQYGWQAVSKAQDLKIAHGMQAVMQATAMRWQTLARGPLLPSQIQP